MIATWRRKQTDESYGGEPNAFFQSCVGRAEALSTQPRGQRCPLSSTTSLNRMCGPGLYAGSGSSDQSGSVAGVHYRNPARALCRRFPHEVGTWLSLVERTLGVGEVASSNLVVPTISSADFPRSGGIRDLSCTLRARAGETRRFARTRALLAHGPDPSYGSTP